jgi:hypothetical protein
MSGVLVRVRNFAISTIDPEEGLCCGVSFNINIILATQVLQRDIFMCC